MIDSLPSGLRDAVVVALLLALPATGATAQEGGAPDQDVRDAPDPVDILRAGGSEKEESPPDRPLFLVDLRAGASVGELASAGSGFQFQPGPVVGLTVLRDLGAHLRGYVNYTRSSFGCEDGFCEEADVRLGGQGVGAGLEARWNALRGHGGVVFQSGRSSWSWPDQENGGRRSASSEWGLGFELGAGAEVPVAERFLLTPGVRYVRFSSSFPDSPTQPDAADDVMTYVSADLGIRILVPRGFR